ncbi:hypothetical protein HAZT_HAZT008728 [Hyalella azteca]|uniref:Uncharacterized protein n=1 Tax=Hyalella azteca TaxID=294128 RepID=A0A6A0GPJ4_HYAAZ|nr:hypothetical protein HAZT_HAZT008728 [Hyalella azteca]
MLRQVTLPPKVKYYCFNPFHITHYLSCSQEEASTLAASYDCKFIETSSALNHRVDELLVGLLKQIRLKAGNLSANSESAKKRLNRRKFRGRKTSASVKVRSFLTKVCGKEPKSKSCENLLVL